MTLDPLAIVGKLGSFGSPFLLCVLFYHLGTLYSLNGGLPQMREIHLITPYIVTHDFPALSAGSVLTKPVDTPTRSPALNSDYTDAELRAIIKTHQAELVGGVKLLPNAIESLPEGFLYETYMYVVYGLPPSPQVFPACAGTNFSTSWLALCSYPVISCLLANLYKELSITIDPVLKYRADNILRLLRFVNYSWLETAKLHTVNPQLRERVVVSKSKTIQVLGNVAEEKETYYLNAILAKPLLDAGSTVEDLVDYYESTGLQPS